MLFRSAAHVGTELVNVASELPTRYGVIASHRLWHGGQHQGAGKVRLITPLAL